MTPEAIRKEIYDTVESTWATANTIAWPNQPFNPEPTKSWVRPTILMGDSVYGEIGDEGVGIRVGELIIQIFVPTGGGVKNANTKATAFEAAFRREDLSGVLFHESSTRDIGLETSVGSKKNFYQVNVHIPFHAFIGE